MRKRTPWMVACAAIGCIGVGSQSVWGAHSSFARTASARGTMAFDGDHDMDGAGNGRGMIVFEISSRKGGFGRLLFAAENPHDSTAYPDVVVELEEMDEVSFGRTKVTFSGTGLFHQDRAFIRATASDGAGTGEDDHFKIIVTRPNGELIFEAAGELFLGDISIE